MSDEQAVAEVVVNEPEAILETAEAVDPNLLDSEESEAQEIAQDSEENFEQTDAWVKKRIDELTRDKHEARRYSERLEKLLEQQEQMLKQFAPKNESQAPKLAAPDPNDFAGGQYDPRYMDAMLQYTRVSAVEEAKAAVAAEYEQRAATQTAMAAQAKLENAEIAARVKFADYDIVIEGITSDPRLAQNATIRQALLGLDNGPEIAYMLGRNLDVAYEIAGLDNPIAAGMKLAEIINRAPRAKSNAPTPIKPLNGAAGGVPRNVKNYAEMTTVEYIAARNAEDLAKKQAMMRR